MPKFRPVRELLSEAMAKVVEVNTWEELEREAIPESLRPLYGPNPKVLLEYQRFDERIEWDTWIVTVNGQAAGYTNGPILRTE
jgi:hypothetical protein